MFCYSLAFFIRCIQIDDPQDLFNLAYSSKFLMSSWALTFHAPWALSTALGSGYSF